MFTVIKSCKRLSMVCVTWLR